MTYADIQNLFYELTKTNVTSMPNAKLNLYTQPSENKIQTLILQSDGRWQYDDANYTTLPIGTFDLVSGQQDYSLTTSQLRIEGCAILTNAGIWQRLLPFDPEDLKAHFGPLIDRAEFFKTPGRPLFYDKQANSLLLYPAPDNGITVTLTAGLKLYLERSGLVFDYSTGKLSDSTGSTSSSPGFNPLFHDLIAYEAAYRYCIVNLPQLANGYLAEIQRQEAALMLAYNMRDKDERSKLTMAPIHFR